MHTYSMGIRQNRHTLSLRRNYRSQYIQISNHLALNSWSVNAKLVQVTMSNLISDMSNYATSYNHQTEMDSSLTYNTLNICLCGKALTSMCLQFTYHLTKSRDTCESGVPPEWVCTSCSGVTIIIDCSRFIPSKMKWNEMKRNEKTLIVSK